MADENNKYDIPKYVDKRLRYFNNQFLQEGDFIDEQKYSINRQRLHNRSLHTPGVAEGLDVQAEIGATQVQIEEGAALDEQGRQIVLLNRQSGVEVKDRAGKPFKQQRVLLVISYPDQEQASDVATVGGQGATRWWEQPKIEFYLEAEAPSENSHLRLALLEIGDDGKISRVDTSVRKIAGGKTGVTDNSIDEAKLSGDVRGKLVNTGNKHNHTDGNGDTIKHSNLDLELNTDTNPHKTTAIDVKALSLEKGGTVKGPVTIDNTSKLDVLGRVYVEKDVRGIYNPNPATDETKDISQTGSIFVVNKAQNSYGLVAKVTKTAQDVPNQKRIPPAAVAAIGGFPGVNGIYATAQDPTDAVYVEGNVTVTGVINGKLANPSSRELKENITNFSAQEAIEILAGLNPVKFNYREDKTKETTVGFIAEDVPDLVAASDKKGIYLAEIVAVLTKIIKEQQQQISLLQERVNVLEIE